MERGGGLGGPRRLRDLHVQLKLGGQLDFIRFAEFNVYGPGKYCSYGTAIITTFSHPSVWQDRFKMEGIPWKFAILACGGASYQVSLEKGVPPIEMQSFHIYGEKDRHLSDSKAISEYWDVSQRTMHTHDRGHEIDMQMWRRETEMMVKLDRFLDQQQ